jgi:uncharacterized membrane protein YeaQ/YmgE (transglycosylase-associated protein family)
VSVALIALIIVILLLAFGFGVLGFALSVLGTLVWYCILGLVIGGLARLFVKGRSGMGLVATILYGVAGSLLGGVIANGWLDLGGIGQFLTAIACAAILVIVTRPATR